MSDDTMTEHRRWSDPVDGRLDVHDTRLDHLERDTAQIRDAVLSLAKDFNQLVQTVGSMKRVEERLDKLETSVQDSMTQALTAKIDAQNELLADHNERRRAIFSEMARTLFAIAAALLLYHWGVH